MTTFISRGDSRVLRVVQSYGFHRIYRRMMELNRKFVSPEKQARVRELAQVNCPPRAPNVPSQCYYVRVSLCLCGVFTGFSSSSSSFPLLIPYVLFGGSCCFAGPACCINDIWLEGTAASLPFPHPHPRLHRLRPLHHSPPRPLRPVRPPRPPPILIPSVPVPVPVAVRPVAVRPAPYVA
jgi:hypothetical protein